MGLNDKLYNELSNDEMHELRNITSRATTRLFQAASDLFGKMSRTSIHAPEYTQMQGQAAILMAAGREQMALCGEVGVVIWERADLHAASAMATGYDWSADNA